jgi:prepilin peptidase CpaA
MKNNMKRLWQEEEGLLQGRRLPCPRCHGLLIIWRVAREKWQALSDCWSRNVSDRSPNLRIIMNSTETIWVLALVLACCGGWSDWRTRRIPNWLTVSGAVAGLAANAILRGWHGAILSLEGAGLALGLLLPLVLLRGFGAGDWKLMGAMGAVMGWQAMLSVLFVSVLIAGVVAVLQMVAAKRVKQTFGNVMALVMGFATFGLRPNPEITLDNPNLIKQPFGAAVAAATVFSFVLSHWRH